MRDNIVDYNLMHNLMNHEFHAIVFNKHPFVLFFITFHNFSYLSQILFP